MPAQTVSNSDGTLTRLPYAPTVRVRVTALNDANESQSSDTKEAVVG